MKGEDEGENNPSEEVARWLQEAAGRKRSVRPKESDEPLPARIEVTPARARNTKHIVMAALLTVAFLQYYFIDVHLQIMMQPTLTVFVHSHEMKRPGRSRARGVFDAVA